MQWVYPNLDINQYKKVLSFTFWMFSVTCLAMVAIILGMNTGAITPAVAGVMKDLIGPAIATNVVTLVYLADQNRRALNN